MLRKSNLTSCLFCQIIAGKKLGYLLTKTRNAIAILDAFPQTPGHTLIISTRCVPNLSFLTDQELLGIQKLSQTVAKRLETHLHAQGFNFINNYNQIAGQVINHYHLHVIPRYETRHLRWEKTAFTQILAQMKGKNENENSHS